VKGNFFVKKRRKAHREGKVTGNGEQTMRERSVISEKSQTRKGGQIGKGEFKGHVNRLVYFLKR